MHIANTITCFERFFFIYIKNKYSKFKRKCVLA
jgi:hypothetical protein